MSESLESNQSEYDLQENTWNEHGILETEESQELIVHDKVYTDPENLFDTKQRIAEEARSRQMKIDSIRVLLETDTDNPKNLENSIKGSTQVETTEGVMVGSVENKTKGHESFRDRLKEGFKSFVLQLKTFFERKKSETNIHYRADRYYRCIGKGGYEDFIRNGTIRSKNSRKYADVSFNIGEPAPLYLAKDPSYILEATDAAAQFKPKINFYDPNQREMYEIPYRGCDPNEITDTSPIRIFEQVSPGVYRVVFDNIHDEALID